MSKKVCKIKKHKDGSVELCTASPKFQCRKCKGVAHNKKKLCKPKEL